MSNFYTFNAGDYRAEAVPLDPAYGQYTGDWMIEEQSLIINYARIPFGYLAQPSAFDYFPNSLSGVVVRNMRPTYTNLHYLVRARYSVKKEVGTTYLTPSDVQTQRFQIGPSRYDRFGNDYGPVSGAWKLGPQGVISNSRPYRRRVPWDDAVHTEIDRYARGTNIAVIKIDKGLMFLDIKKYSEVWAEGFDWNSFSNPPHITHTYSAETDNISVKRSNFATASYQLFGAYSTSQETPIQAQTFINRVGTDIATSNLWGDDLTPYQHITGCGWYNNQFEVPNSGATVGFSEYNILRHDMS